MSLVALQYLAVFTTFVGAVVALIGETWDSQSHGLSKLKPIGWVAFIALVLGLVASAKLIHRADVKADVEKQQRAMVRTIAHREIQYACRLLASPYFEMYFAATGVHPNSNSPQGIDELVSKPGLEALEGTNFYDRLELDLVGLDTSPFKVELFAFPLF